MNELLRDMLLDLVCDAFDAGLISGTHHDTLLAELNGIDVEELS